MTVSARPPVADPEITADLVMSLLRAQVPEACQFRLGEPYAGKDAVVWRLGNDWAVRLPRRQLAADRQHTELDWMPHLSQNWRFRAPVPVRVGSPARAYPWRWSIVPWVPGIAMHEVPLSLTGAAELGAALANLHQLAPAHAPRHPRWSHSLLARSARTDDRLGTLARRTEVGPWRLDLPAAQRIYHAGAAQSPVPHRWAHLDMRAHHIMTFDGRFVGLIDWGDSAAADPAVDLGQTLISLPMGAWDAFIVGYGGVDLATFARARAVAVETAATLALSPHPYDRIAGWAGLVALGVAYRAS